MTNWEVTLIHMLSMKVKSVIIDAETIQDAFEKAEAAYPAYASRSARFHCTDLNKELLQQIGAIL